MAIFVLILTQTAQINRSNILMPFCYESNFCFNGDFEILSKDNKPEGWGFFSENGSTALFTNQTHNGANAIILSSKSKSIAGINQIYIPPDKPIAAIFLLRGLIKFWYKAISSEVEGKNLNLYVIPLADILLETGTRAKFVVHRSHVGDGQWHEGQLEYDFTNTQARYAIIAPRINESVINGSGEWIVDDIRVFEIEQKIEVISIGPSKPWFRLEENGKLTIRLRNSSTEPINNVSLHLYSNSNYTIVEPKVFKIKMLEPGTTHNLEAILSFKKDNVSCIDFEIVFGQTRLFKSIPIVVIATNDSATVWGNDKIRLKLSQTQHGYTQYEIEGYDGKSWQLLGFGYCFASIDYLDRSSRCRTDLVIPDKITIADTLLILYNDRSQWTFATSQTSNLVDIQFKFIADREYEMLNLSGISFYWGENSFAQKKTDALFPGLEWLVGDESSSDTLDAISEYKDRFMPHPEKITIPLMALRTPYVGMDNKRFLVSLLWDANQKWYKDYTMPAVTFASPNFLQNQQNHFMSISLPSVPEFKSENDKGYARPLSVKKGDSLVLKCKFLIEPEVDLLKSIDHWVQHFGGLPEPPPLPITNDDAVKLSAEAFLDVLWNNEEQGWHHSLTDIWPPSLDPVIIKLLDITRLTTNDTLLKKAISNHLPKTTDQFIAGDLDLAFRMGHIREGLNHEDRVIDEIMTKQNSDGYWRFEPTKEQQILNKIPDPAIKNNAIGVSGSHIYRLLHFARITGDSIATKAAFTGLNFIDSVFSGHYAVPRGAQLWEVPIHCPDVLASAHSILAYLEAYKITNESHYLKKAIYWARSGLPFICLWNASHNEIMLYGSVPVFGASWFNYPWFGKLVQWNGLEYAYALILLSQFDKTFDWLKIARGITNCAIQQQLWLTKYIPEHTGLYPDAFDVISQEPPYQWDFAPILVLKNLMALQGIEFEIYTHKFETGNNECFPIIISSATPIDNIFSDRTNSLKIDLGKSLSNISHLLVTNIKTLGGIEWSRRNQRMSLNLLKVNEGYQFVPTKGILIIKIKHFQPISIWIKNIEPLGTDSIHPLAWDFNFNGDTEGWQPTNDISTFEVQNGHLFILTNGSDPYIITDKYNIPSERFNVFEIKMKMSKKDKFQLFWKVRGDEDFSEINSMFFNVHSVNTFVTYKLDLSKHSQWRHQIKQLRLDLGTQPDLQINVDYIKLK